MSKGKRNRERRDRLKGIKPVIGPISKINEQGMEPAWASFTCTQCGQWWSSPTPIFAVVGEGIHEFAITAPCPNCGAPVRSTETEREHLADGRVLVRPKPTYPEFTLDGREALVTSKPDSCAFCDLPITRVNASHEHVLGKWLRKVRVIKEHFAEREGAGKWRWTLDHPLITSEGAVLIPRPRKLASKPLHTLYTTVSVCTVCNSGWLSQLENEVKPILTPLINGESLTIKGPDRVDIARWAIKTAIAFEQDDPPSARIGRVQIRDVRNGRPARWSAVWVAKWETPKDVLLRHGVLAAYLRDSGEIVAEWGCTHIALGQGFALRIVTSPVPVVDLAIVAPPEPWQQLWPGLPEDLVLRGEPVSRADIEAMGTPQA